MPKLQNYSENKRVRISNGVKKKIIIPSNLKNIKHAVDEILDYLKSIEVEGSVIFDIRLGLEEALINAVKYGNRFNESLTVDVDFTHNGNKVIIAVEDKGNGFDYRNLPDPTREENLLKPKGRGIFLIKHLMDDVEFNRRGNCITMVKFLMKNKGG